MVFQIKVPKGELMRTTFSTASIYAYAMSAMTKNSVRPAGCTASHWPVANRRRAAISSLMGKNPSTEGGLGVNTSLWPVAHCT